MKNLIFGMLALFLASTSFAVSVQIHVKTNWDRIMERIPQESQRKLDIAAKMAHIATIEDPFEKKAAQRKLEEQLVTLFFVGETKLWGHQHFHSASSSKKATDFPATIIEFIDNWSDPKPLTIDFLWQLASVRIEPLVKPMLLAFTVDHWRIEDFIEKNSGAIRSADGTFASLNHFIAMWKAFRPEEMVAKEHLQVMFRKSMFQHGSKIKQFVEAWQERYGVDLSLSDVLIYACGEAPKRTLDPSPYYQPCQLEDADKFVLAAQNFELTIDDIYEISNHAELLFRYFAEHVNDKKNRNKGFEHLLKAAYRHYKIKGFKHRISRRVAGIVDSVQDASQVAAIAVGAAAGATPSPGARIPIIGVFGIIH